HVHGVGEHHVVAELAVVGDVRVGHQQAVAPDHRAPGGGRAAVQGRELPDERAVSDLQGRTLALELQILRIRAQDGPVRDLAILPERGVTLHGDPRADLGAVSDPHPRADDGPGSDHDTFAELRIRIDEGGGVDAGLAACPDGGIAHLSTILAMNSASATRWSSTNPSPRILHVFRLSWSISSSKT